MPLKAGSSVKVTQDSAAPPHAPRPPPSNFAMSDRPSARPTTNGEMHAPKNNQTPKSISPSVNRKKQKRRQKHAARLAANHSLHNGYVSTDVTDHAGLEDHAYNEADPDDAEPQNSANGDVYSDEEQFSIDVYHGMPNPGLDHDHQGLPGRKSKTKGGKGPSSSQTIADGSSTPQSTPSVSMSHAFPPPLPPHFGPRAILRSARDRSIWNTSTQEERENIKTFWLELGEEERRQLVKVEKDAVLKKMKEQQKHSCSCTVCGRKRTAIEEELEVLYDAYYEELEQYANNNQGSFEKNSPIVPPPRLYHPPLRSPGQHTRNHGQFHPSRGRIHELPEEEEEDLEEEYDEEEEEEDEVEEDEEEEDDEPYSDEEEDDDDLEDEDARAARADFFAFGNSLTVKDGILTVADDLLKNDGKHFIDMMEQLAERRMQREEDTQYGIAAAHQSLHAGHNHGPLDEEYYDDEEDEDYDSQEEEDYEEDEMVCPGVVGPFSSSHLEGRCMLTEFYQDAMTEEQRMEEGRRMFQIFAARMFEQRVLTAYREKVAEQRQQKLIEELMEEETRNEQRSAKKAREAQKKKDKKRLQRQAKDEEKARREAEKAAEEAAAKAAQDKKLEDSRRKKEEQRKKREAERKVQEEERARKEAEKQRRLQEERDRQAEAERKHREKKEQEKKRREEARQKDKEEQESREQKAKEDQLRKKAERDAQTTKRASHPSIPSNLSQPQGPSPHSQATAPAVPKAPTPARPRQPSLQGSHASSPRSQQASTEPSQVSVSPRSMPPSQSSGASSATSKHGLAQHPMLPHPQPSTPLSPLGSSARSHPTGLFGINGLPSHPPGLSGMAPRPSMGPELPAYPPHSGSLMSPLRGFPAPNGVPMPPGMNGVRPMPPGRGFPLEPGHGLPFHSQQPMASAFSPHQGGLSQAHSRQPSSSFERSPLDNHDNHAQPMPISRPSPIKRPSSTAPQDQQRDNGRTGTQQDVEELSAHLGSSALLDDTDAPFASSMSQSLPGAGATAPGSFRPPNRASFGTPSYFADPLGGKLILQDFQNQITDNFTASKHPGFPLGPSGVGGNTWGAQLPFGASPFPGSSTWGSGPGSGWLNNNAFGSGGFHRTHTSRPVTIRLLVIQACKQLNTISPSKDASGYHDVHVVLRQIDQLRPPNEPTISLKEMLDICDTEGNTQNGGGSFSIHEDSNGQFVKFEPDNNSAASGHRGSSAPGEIGSPMPKSSVPAFGGIGSPSILRQFSSPPTGF